MIITEDDILGDPPTSWQSASFNSRIRHRPGDKCAVCGVRFTFSNYGAKGLCNRCYNSKRRKDRRNNPNDPYRENEKQRAKIYYHSVYQKRRDEFLNQFKTPCIKCGEADTSCIVFHHVDPSTKLFCVGDGSLGKRTNEEVIAEINKCICLCENCHRKFHHRYYHQLDNPRENLFAFIMEEKK